MGSRYEGCLQNWSVFPRATSSSSFWAARWTAGLKTRWANLGLLLELGHEGELKRTWCISLTNTIILKFGVQSTKLCLLAQLNPVPFPSEDSGSYWIAQEVSVGASVQTGKPECTQVVFKILPLIQCCAYCRAGSSTGKHGCGTFGSSVF